MDLIIKNAIVERNIQTLTLGSTTFILHEKIYFTEGINVILCPHELNAFVEQLNELNLDDDEITTMDKFAGTTTDIILKNNTYGVSSLCLGCKIAMQYIWNTQVGNLPTCRDLFYSLTI